ncbi:hypothetical protein CF319_g4254 [Tilletia indica]|nr:hypothetical protein CF319_g4254 [Tilletia indica]
MWPSERVVKLVKASNYVPMWYFTAAGCRHAAKERRNGTEQTIFWHEGGGMKPAGHPAALVDDHHLPPLEFHDAASLWVEVATRAKVSKRVLDFMILFNHEVFGSSTWRTDPVSMIQLHNHQRSTWSGISATTSHSTRWSPWRPSPLANITPASAADPHTPTWSTGVSPLPGTTDQHSSSRKTPPGRTASASSTTRTKSASASTPAGARDKQIAIDAHGARSPVTATSSAPEPIIAAKPTLGPTPLLAPGWKIRDRAATMGTRAEVPIHTERLLLHARLQPMHRATVVVAGSGWMGKGSSVRTSPAHSGR